MTKYTMCPHCEHSDPEPEDTLTGIKSCYNCGNSYRFCFIGQNKYNTLVTV